MLQWSHGEILTSDTLDKKTLKPHHLGLVSTAVFGPMKDYECSCGRLSGVEHSGDVCKHCNTEITISAVRKERMGHISLITPVVLHRHLFPLIALVLDLPADAIDKIAHYDAFIVADSGETGLPDRTLLNRDEWLEISESEIAEQLYAPTGGEALYFLLSTLDLQDEFAQSSAELILTTYEQRRSTLKRRLRLISAFANSSTRPEWMTPQYIPVLPAGIRELTVLPDGTIRTYLINELYREVITANSRTELLMETLDPNYILVRKEKLRLQKAVARLTTLLVEDVAPAA